MAKKNKNKPEDEPVVILPEDVNTANGCAEGETQLRCGWVDQPLRGFSHIQSIVIQEVVKNKTKTFTYPIKEAAAPLRHANKYLLGNQRVIVPGMDTDDNLQYKYSYVGEGIQIHVFWATKKPKLCDKN